MQESVTGGAVIHVCNDVVARRHFLQDAQRPSTRWKSLQPNRRTVQQTWIRLAFIPESDLKSLRVQSKGDLPSVQALRIHVARVDHGQEQHTNLIHGRQSRKDPGSAPYHRSHPQGSIAVECLGTLPAASSLDHGALSIPADGSPRFATAAYAYLSQHLHSMLVSQADHPSHNRELRPDL